MIKVRYPIIVEGRYDKIKLHSLVEADIITTEGFRIFSDREKLAMIKSLAAQDKVILLTDSDRAGFRIRGYLAGAIPPERLVQVYIPQREGKERRKQKPSAEGTLGVEGISADCLRRLFEQAGVIGSDEPGAAETAVITKQMLYELGLSGGPNSALLRRELARRLELPAGISANALCAVLSRLMTPEQLAAEVAGLADELHTD